MAQITLNPAVAREHGEYAAALYDYLQDKQTEFQNYGDGLNKRRGIKWIVALAYTVIRDELPIFPDLNTVKRAGKTLVEAGLVLAETTGAFLEPDHKTGRKRDVATWWHVSRDHVPRKDVPADYFDRGQRIAFDSDEAREHGIPFALILAYWRAQKPSDEAEDFKVLSPAEMAKVLPGKEQALARQIKAMVGKGLLLEPATQPKHRKLYILPSEVRKLKKQPTWAQVQAGKIESRPTAQ